MTASISSSADDPERRMHARRALHAAIRARWSKFTDFEVGALANTSDLVSQVAIKYGLELSRARRDVEDLLKGRKI
ncbi:MAG: hypothetical protein ABI216_22340 [Devosia sp.]